MGREEVVKRAVGKADAFELLSCAFAYPDERLAQGLVDGSFADDEMCIRDRDRAGLIDIETLARLRGSRQDDKRPQQQQEARQRQQHHAVTQQRRLDDLSDVLVPFAHAGILVQMAAVRYARRGNRHNDDDLGAARLAGRPFDALHNKVYTRSYRSTHEQGIILSLIHI